LGNSVGETEQRRLISIDSENTIKWKKKLQHEFGKKSRFLFRWENVPDNESETDRLIQFLKDYFNLFWVESATVIKENGNTIKISHGDESVEITLNQVIKKALLKISDDRIYHLQMTQKDGMHNIYASTIRALNYLVEINLKPFPSYPFPGHATLIRGLILNSEEDPVEEAQVKVADYEIETKSTKNGEFALYLAEIDEPEMFKKNEESKKIEIIIKKNDAIKTIKTVMMKGRTKFLGKITFP